MGTRSWSALFLFALSLFVYLYNYPYRFWGAGGDTTAAELLPLAIARNHSLYFDGFEHPDGYWYQRVNGHTVSSYPIVPGFFNIPAYAIAHWRGVLLDSPHRSLLSMVTASILTATSVAFFFLALSNLVVRRSTAIASALVYAFGTTAMSVAARGMWQHGPSLFFLTSGLWLLTVGTRITVALSGLAFGFAVFNRPVNLLIVAPLALYVLWKHGRAFLPFCAAAAIPAILMAWYSIHYWGSVRSLGQYSASGLFSGQVGPSLAGLLFSPSRGLLVFTPLFLFSFIALFAILRHPLREPLLAALAVGIVATIALYAKWFSWWGGTCFGYRLLTEIAPLLTIFLAAGWERFFAARRYLYPLLGIAAVVSLYTHFLGAFYAPCGSDDHKILWSWRGGELARCTSKLADRVRTHLPQ
ncbi:MAG TPA: hypothetical protein VJ867_03370 [Gemmatimonadaceae bacterium]|nr:hypothetical protein [Gemmatimonadaceae bacterium]